MKTRNIDYKLFFTIFALIIFGMIMISSVSVYPSFQVTSKMVAAGKLDSPSNSFYLFRNLSHVFMSLLVFVFVVKIPYHWFEKYAKHIFVWSLLFLLVVLFVGETYNGAKGWITIPFLPFSLQPAEFLKGALVLYFAYFLKKKKKDILDFREGFIPFIVTLGVMVILLGLQPDFWTILIIVPMAVLMFYVAGGQIKHLLVTGLIATLIPISVYMVGSAHETGKKNSLTYISDRLDNFFTTNKNAIQNDTINYQTKQGLLAIGSGWFFGLWFWKSVQKFWYLPEVQGDFIFSVISEELWFFGVFILIWTFLFIAYRGIYIAVRTEDSYGKYVAIGITSWIIIQAFINIWVNLNIVPLTGVTMPFVSYGWSSLLSLMVWVGILLNISREIDYEKPLLSNMSFFRKKRM